MIVCDGVRFGLRLLLVNTCMEDIMREGMAEPAHDHNY